ncbi:3-isopropylmalate dehydrogenase [Paremcibacter congregatus]|uniref:3-isopropylmalate dehydrogenase n=1 Tax=Paremcibacter congregatus TaxID=2043170 RepID=A0A2G4YRN0_9PROT|nr:3-isopropylmalate dehydrogenase [Paremcibacter congregatus]PHZ84116.1 3-isopropylmalate dehydrogenase [Paremcibacter congregatus]QDE25825.1 3-isopropylmalate dehydrogenase [Paremcibacter congregatus]|tara:strand:- start:7 stop:1104 length:1098 start_codon:yes stop_codon:yes gene_type:complete
MRKELSLLMLPGDGIGPEIMIEARRVIDWLAENRSLKITVHEDMVGGAAYDAYGKPLSDEALALAKQVDAVLLGAVGGPKWDGVDYDKRPEAGLLTLRKELDLFANLRPAVCFEALVDASSLKPELVSGLDIMIVRELTGGVYFGEPRGIETLENGERRGINTQVYTTSEIHRIAHVAFDLAGKRDGRVTSSEKANVMESGLLWREEVIKVAESYPDITLDHMLADSCAMQLVRAPKQFDVIVTDNLFGDLLSDVAAMLTGSLGMLPSASLGAKGGGALYEPVHGSAPDIAGQGIANPIATILSLAMALRYTYERPEEAQLIEDAVQGVLAGGLRTADIMQPGKAKVSTSVMGDSILRQLDRLNA